MESLNSNSQEREMHQLQQMQDKAKEKCIESFRLLYSHLKVLSIKGGFERACVALFDQDNQTFTESLSGLILMNQFQTFINFRYCFDDFEGAMICKSFLENTRTEIQQFRDTLIQLMESVKKTIDERAQHKRENNRRVNDRVMQSKEEKESERHVSSSRSGKDTHAENANINSVNDQVPLVESKDVQIQEGKVDMESSGTKSDEQDTSSRSRNDADTEDAVIRPVNDQVSLVEERVSGACTANHDACITKFLKEVNSRAKIQPNKTRNSNKPVDPTSHTQKPGRKIVTGHSFSPNKSSAVHEKTNTPRSYLRWIPTGRIFNTAGLKWVPTGTTFTSSTTKVDCELPNGSNDCITNPYKCDQTLNVSASTLNLSAGTFCNPEKERLGVCLLKKVIYQKPRVPGIYAPLLKEKKSVRFSALFLQKKRNPLVS
ncbi:hypothetical protein Tco_1303447 [Tanacetum coccineum]